MISVLMMTHRCANALQRLLGFGEAAGRDLRVGAGSSCNAEARMCRLPGMLDVRLAGVEWAGPPRELAEAKLHTPIMFISQHHRAGRAARRDRPRTRRRCRPAAVSIAEDALAKALRALRNAGYRPRGFEIEELVAILG